MTQKEALNILKLGHNVYLTGPAGSGKTYLLNQYIAYLKENAITVGISASTGIAATHMGGTTIHSWCGMGIRDSITTGEINEMIKRPYLKKRFLRTKVLIIDEVSMLHSFQLDMIDHICRVAKKNDQPFGGMQMIMCGDFFQLPPVSKSRPIPPLDPDSQASLYDDEKKPQADGTDFVTESLIWSQMQLRICYLDEQHRQDDRAFLRILNDIRSGGVTEDTVEALSERMNKEPEGFSSPTRLFTHNADVDTINNSHLEALPSEAHEYFMSSRGSIKIIEGLKKNCLAPTRLLLKKGAQVMFVKNNYEVGYVNGTLGEVIGFTREDAPIVRTFDGSEITVAQMSWEIKEENVELAAISQIPLRLAWAITVHKSQGMSLDAAEVDLSRSFVPGQGYVALSRLRNLAGLKLMGINQMALTVNANVSEMDREFRKESDQATLGITSMEQTDLIARQKDYLVFMKR